MKTRDELRILQYRAEMRGYAMQWRQERDDITDVLLLQPQGTQAAFYLGIAKDYRDMALAVAEKRTIPA